jgi:hypothetical protein
VSEFHVYYACLLLHEQTFLYLNLNTYYEFDGQGHQIRVTKAYGATIATVTGYTYDQR